jgi:hypothetical protein
VHCVRFLECFFLGTIAGNPGKNLAKVLHVAAFKGLSLGWANTGLLPVKVSKELLPEPSDVEDIR